MFDYMGDTKPLWPDIRKTQDDLSRLIDLILKVRDELGALAFTEPGENRPDVRARLRSLAP